MKDSLDPCGRSGSRYEALLAPNCIELDCAKVKEKTKRRGKNKRERKRRVKAWRMDDSSFHSNVALTLEISNKSYGVYLLWSLLLKVNCLSDPSTLSLSCPLLKIT